MPPGIWIVFALLALFFLNHRRLLQRSLIIFSLLIWFLLENSKQFSLNLFYVLLITFSFYQQQ